MVPRPSQMNTDALAVTYLAVQVLTQMVGVTILAAQILTQMVAEHQRRRKEVTDVVLERFTAVRPMQCF